MTPTRLAPHWLVVAPPSSSTSCWRSTSGAASWTRGSTTSGESRSRCPPRSRRRRGPRRGHPGSAWGRAWLLPEL